MRPAVLTVTTTTVTANGIAASQTPGAAGNLTLNGSFVTSGVATLPFVGRVGITSAGNDSGRTFTITGIDLNGNTVTEAVTGPNTTTSVSQIDYQSVSKIAVDAATAGAITAGNNAKASSNWYVLDTFAKPQISLQCVVVSGSPNYTVETTLDNVLRKTQPFTVFASSDANVVAATTNQQSNFAFMPMACRVTINSGAGSVAMTVIQPGPER